MIEANDSYLYGWKLQLANHAFKKCDGLLKAFLSNRDTEGLAVSKDNA